jgi:hypothetical protein
MFGFNKDSISFKISVGYLIVIACILLTSIFTLLTLYSNKQSDTVLVKMYLPALNTAKDLKMLTLESKKLAYNWIYNPTNQEKQRFNEILKTDLSKSKNEIALIIQSAENQDSLILLLDKKIKAEIDNLVISYEEIPSILSSDDAYSDDSTVDKAIGVYNSEVESKATNLMDNTEYLIKFIETNIAIINQKKADLYMQLTYMVFFSLFTIIAVSIFFTNFSKNKVSKPIIQLRDIIAKLGQGEEVADANLELNRKDEIGQISNALSKLNTGLISKSAFAKAIGEAQYDFQFELLGENDVMGKSLIHMKDNLLRNHIEDKNRNWVNVGLANIGEILRKTFASQHDFYNEIIQFIVKYLHANQGGVFILNDSQENEKFLELTACYAYERKKFLEKRIEIGEGLVGQCFLEKDIIFLTEVPQNYVSITSGLGDSTPNCLVIVPLIYNENILGVLEIASFKIFEKFEIEFIKKLAESVASSISTVKINERTRKLLEHSQQQTEEMRSQEEEMRQNMEELMATQEEMNRKENAYLKEIEALKQELNKVKNS